MYDKEKQKINELVELCYETRKHFTNCLEHLEEAFEDIEKLAFLNPNHQKITDSLLKKIVDMYAIMKENRLKLI